MAVLLKMRMMIMMMMIWRMQFSFDKQGPSCISVLMDN
jgi:hypothetical protein